VTTGELLARLRGLKIQLRADNDRLICSGPKGALPADLCAASANRRRRRRKQQTQQMLPINPLSGDTDLPLSFPRQRLWFLCRLQSDSSIYNVPSGFRITGPLNIEALKPALGEIVRRHEALRTMFSVP
jgi:hypothetical protein